MRSPNISGRSYLAAAVGGTTRMLLMEQRTASHRFHGGGRKVDLWNGLLVVLLVLHGRRGSDRTAISGYCGWRIHGDSLWIHDMHCFVGDVAATTTTNAATTTTATGKTNGWRYCPVSA